VGELRIFRPLRSQPLPTGGDFRLGLRNAILPEIGVSIGVSRPRCQHAAVVAVHSASTPVS
jgi:hypothetical protein